MKLEQILVIVYLFIGISMGLVSDYLNNSMGLIYAVVVPVIVYAVSISAFLSLVKERKIRVVILNSFVTFILFWLVAWIFLHNV